MQWFEKFKVGQKVKVVKRVVVWKFSNGGGCSWNSEMDATIGKTYKIKSVDRVTGYELSTENDTYYKFNYWYPAEALQSLAGVQLLFNFMS